MKTSALVCADDETAEPKEQSQQKQMEKDDALIKAADVVS